MTANWRSFDQLYPTNHIHFGYMDRMSWKNMNHLAFGLQLRPNKDSHFEVTGHLFSRQEATDGVYHAGQAQFLAPDNNSTDVGEEVDVVYTHFFTPGNHVAWQIGGGVFLPGQFIDNNGPAWWECLRTNLGLYPTLGKLLTRRNPVISIPAEAQPSAGIFLSAIPGKALP